MLHNKDIYHIHQHNKPQSFSEIGSQAALEFESLLQDCHGMLYGFDLTCCTACTCLLVCMPSHVRERADLCIKACSKSLQIAIVAGQRQLNSAKMTCMWLGITPYKLC